MIKPSSPAPKRPDKPAKKPRESRIGQLLSALSHKLFLVIMSVVLIAAGAGITYVIQQDAWAQKAHHEYQKQLVDKRIDLMERTALLMSKSLAVQDMQKTSKKSALAAIARLGLDPGSIVDVITESLDKQTLAKCRFLESQAEYETLLKLNAIFFGDRTRRVVKEMMKLNPWWSVDAAQRAKLVAALDHDFFQDYAASP
ncbi:MAG: hypothetical protein IID14_08395 [Candidatus Marinimicrobia bacterium]|nr:hypothetical protein [Candidatus Neomarinimicrobiota bacterium]